MSAPFPLKYMSQSQSELRASLVPAHTPPPAPTHAERKSFAHKRTSCAPLTESPLVPSSICTRMDPSLMCEPRALAHDCTWSVAIGAQRPKKARWYPLPPQPAAYATQPARCIARVRPPSDSTKTPLQPPLQIPPQQAVSTSLSERLPARKAVPSWRERWASAAGRSRRGAGLGRRWAWLAAGRASMSDRGSRAACAGDCNVGLREQGLRGQGLRGQGLLRGHGMEVAGSGGGRVWGWQGLEVAGRTCTGHQTYQPVCLLRVAPRCWCRWVRILCGGCRSHPRVRCCGGAGGGHR